MPGTGTERSRREMKAKEMAKLPEYRSAEILEATGWSVQHYDDGLVEAWKNVDLSRSLTDGYFDAYRFSYPKVLHTPVNALFRLDISIRTAGYFLAPPTFPTDDETLVECDFEFAVDLEPEAVGEMPLNRLIESARVDLELVRAHEPWESDLYTVFPGEYFIRNDHSGCREPPYTWATYYRVPIEYAERLLALPEDDARDGMQSIVVATQLGKIPLIRGCSTPTTFYDLTRAPRGDWVWDGFDYCIEVRDDGDAGPSGGEVSSHPVSGEVAKRLVAIGNGEAAYREMASIVAAIERSKGAEDSRV